MRRLLTRTASALAALLTVAVASTPVARADQSEETTRLCSGAPACVISTDSWLREGSTPRVTIRGNPNVRGTVRVFRAVVEQGRLTGLAPVSTGGDFFTDAHGIATIDLPIGSSASVGEGGWALVSLSDVTGLDTTRMVGRFVPFGSLTPRLLGDGWAERKPAGQTLDMQVVGAVPGETFRVEVKDADAWHDATAIGTTPTAAEDPQQVSHVRWTVPRGLTGTSHQVRLRAVSDPDRTVSWTFTPAMEGDRAKRLAPFTPPPVGTNLGVPTTDSGSHPRGAIRVASGALVGLGLIAVAVMTRTGRPSPRTRGEDRP